MGKGKTGRILKLCRLSIDYLTYQCQQLHYHFLVTFARLRVICYREVYPVLLFLHPHIAPLAGIVGIFIGIALNGIQLGEARLGH